jgi:hypothetical protein
MIDTRPKTILCDIDGTLVQHELPTTTQNPNYKMTVLDGTLEKLMEWDRCGYNIILITGRREGSRTQTERQLQEAGIVYDQLIMGVGGGVRYLINDTKPDGAQGAFAINVERNRGIGDISI